MLVEEGDTERRVFVDVLAFLVNTTFEEVDLTDRGASLGSVVKRSLEPFVLDIVFEAWDTAETTDCLNWIDTRVVFPVLDLDEGVMKRCSSNVITNVDFATKLNNLLFGFKGCIGRGAGHVHCMMEQVPSLVVNLVDVGSSLDKSFNDFIFSSDEHVFQGEKTCDIHLVDVSSQVKHPVVVDWQVACDVVEERSSTL
jgi:hypothetical protein